MGKRILIICLALLLIVLSFVGFSYSEDLSNTTYFKDGISGLFYYEYKNSELTIVIEKTGERFSCLLPKTLIKIANEPIGKEPIFKIAETDNKKTIKTYFLKMKIGEAEFISSDIEGLYVDIAKVLVGNESQKKARIPSKINVKIKYNSSGMPKMLNGEEMGIGKALLFSFFDNYLTAIGKDPSPYANFDFGDVNVDGLKIFVSMGRISGISVETDKYSTSRGLKVKDSKEKALKLYGLPDSGYYEDDDWVYFLNRGWNGEDNYYISSDDSFSIRFKNGKVKLISFWGYIPAD